MLAPDVVMVSDGGGLAPALLRPVEGADQVARTLTGFARLTSDARLGVVWLNGAPAVRIEVDGDFDTAVSLTVDNGLITRIYAIRNPHKLLEEAVPLSRSGAPL